jgi:hypothetical protein
MMCNLQIWCCNQLPVRGQRPFPQIHAVQQTLQPPCGVVCMLRPSCYIVIVANLDTIVESKKKIFKTLNNLFSSECPFKETNYCLKNLLKVSLLFQLNKWKGISRHNQHHYALDISWIFVAWFCHWQLKIPMLNLNRDCQYWTCKLSKSKCYSRTVFFRTPYACKQTNQKQDLPVSFYQTLSLQEELVSDVY